MCCSWRERDLTRRPCFRIAQCRESEDRICRCAHKQTLLDTHGISFEDCHEVVRAHRATTMLFVEQDCAMTIEVAKVEIKSVADASGLEACIRAGQFAADEVVAVIGKTEGNGGVNDF
ncbi:MAG: hypothetical protein J0H78_22120, partial [Rhizobiales bacterium]|nr:hypothetical protein [Hyphomicrobiales bacterium]